MTRREAYEKHKALWNEIVKMIDEGIEYENISIYKYYALERLSYYDYIFCNCYACEVSKYCTECLVVWNEGVCTSEKSEFLLCDRAIGNGNYALAKKLAYEIANLPLREGLDIDKDVYEDDD